MDKQDSLCKMFPGDITSMQALHAYLAQTGNVGWIFDVIDAAERAGVHGAMELAIGIRVAATKAGIR